jgi:2-methylcitrate dehydratase
MTLVERLADWIAGFDAGSIPEAVRRQTKLIILDSIGCALSALSEDTGHAVVTTASALGGAADATLIGARDRVAVTNAVVANSSLIRALDLNDIYNGARQNGGHPSENVAVALAFGERQAASGLEVLAATVIGYEVFGRLRDIPEAGIEWDAISASRFVVPAMAGRLMGLAKDELANALALSIALGPSLGISRRAEVSAAKSVTNGLAAYSSAMATLLASEGVTGPPTAIEGPCGWSESILGGHDLSSLVEPPGDAFRIMQSSIKAFPCLGTAQAQVGAVLDLRPSIPGGVDNVERIEVRMADIPMVAWQVKDTERRHPRLRETADHSFYFLPAVALIDGELTPRQYEGDRWLTPEVNAVMDRIEIAVDPGLNKYTPGTFPCHVRITCKSGENFEKEMPYAPGHPLNPMTAEQLETKFKHMIGKVAGEWRQVSRQVLDLDSAGSIRPIMELLGGPAEALREE